MTQDLEPPESLAKRQWDVAVVGTGMGGATAGYALARRGHSVLFLERGRLQAAESHVAPGSGDEELAALHAGWWPYAFAHHHGGRVDAFPHPVGCGTGGSSAVFSMVMERFRPDDFRPGRFLPSGAASTIPEEWAIGYDDLAPYYAQAEALYRVRGTLDPLFPAGVCLDP